MRESQLPLRTSTKVQDILDWAHGDMGQTHSVKKSQNLSGFSSRKDEKRLFYLGVKRKRAKSPLKESQSQTCKKFEKEMEQVLACAKLNTQDLYTYSNNSCIAAFFKLFGESNSVIE